MGAMFTGLVEGLGTVLAAREEGGGRVLEIDLGPLAEGAGLGDSVCLGGACMTVDALDGSVAAFRVSPESLRRTTLGALEPGGRVNLERSLRVGDRLGGHFLSGHVDGLGELLAIEQQQDYAEYAIGFPPGFAPLLVPKGSVGVEGVSLTVASLAADRFVVALIPETLRRTTLGGLQPGAALNLEGDLLGKYVLRALALAEGAPATLRDALASLSRA